MTDFILITVDVEDWFQVENFKNWIPFSSWASREIRVEKNTHVLLDLLDSRRATFFILGWLAERFPALVREIYDRGHEVASHGYDHHLCNRQTRADLTNDLSDSKKRLEDIIGAAVTGYRAPSFSIDNDILKIIEACGYGYDSSFNSFGMHGRYGKADLSQFERKGIAVKLSENFYELPVSNVKLGNKILPWGGGGYFRLIPFPIFRAGVRQILKTDGAYLFYMHPWEIDPGQPRVEEASLSYKFRHYTNLKKMQAKLSAVFETFKAARFISCKEFLATN
ncbi:MAG: polysaccharide deacetylase [Desulfobacteraceae bacterium IS3]|nr:MAG: polysaccharide deacetylase [Desulfobacteraceae bacterium IS3]